MFQRDSLKKCACSLKQNKYSFFENLILHYTLLLALSSVMGFPDSSVGKESACNSGDPCLIPGLGSSPGEGKAYRLQYFGLENSMDSIVQGSQRVGQD